MSIAERIHQAGRHFSESEHINALIQVCIALDATAKKQYPEEDAVGTRFKNLCYESSKLITSVASGGPSGERLYLGIRSEWVKPDEDGRVAIEDVYYYLIRCSLIHEATIDSHVSISNSKERGLRIEMLGDGRVSFSPSIVLGLIVAVIGAPCHQGMADLSDMYIPIAGRSIPVAKLWGKRDVILEYFDVVRRLTH